MQCILQMQQLSALGIETRLACAPGGRVASAAHETGLSVADVAFRNSLHVPSILRLRKLLAVWRPEVVVSHSGHDATVSAIAARLAPRRPVLVRARTYQHGVPRAWTYNRFADLTVVPSEEVRRAILSNPRVRAEYVRVLYPGIDFAALDKQAQLPLPDRLNERLSAGRRPLIVHGAMLRPEKGHLFFLDVLARLKPRWPDLLYVAAGEGEMRAAIETRIREKALADNVLLPGVVQPLAPLLARADLAVLPSTFEPLGMFQSEALALGIPVVASWVGGIPETIRDGATGWLVPPEDFAAWVEAVGHLLEQPALAKTMAQAGRGEVRSRFAVESNIRRLLDLIASARRGRHEPVAC